MLVTLTKKSGKAHVLKCRRDDGSETWFQASQANSDFYAAHDLSHYAIETVLGYKTAFYGMVAGGRDLNDFGSQGGLPDTRVYSDEALWVENMGNLMVLCLSEGRNYDQFSEALRMTYPNGGEPKVSSDEFGAIQKKLEELLSQWAVLAPNQSLELIF